MQGLGKERAGVNQELGVYTSAIVKLLHNFTCNKLLALAVMSTNEVAVKDVFIVHRGVR